jgi:DNA-binding response OmpR family regulator
MHHGRIWAESAGRNAGATFILELPLATTPAESSPAETEPARASVTKLRILLVEDHEQTRKTLERLLGRRGHQVTAAATLAEGRKLAAGDSFDLLVSDLGLPDGSGEELMKEVRETKQLKGIALSGYGMEEDVQRSLEAGFAAHLTKPINIEALDKAIERTWRENG